MVEASIAMPPSKSESARALIINALTPEGGQIDNLADCDDTKALQGALGCREGRVDIGAAGTAMRFLTAFYASQPGVDVVLDGSERMRERPIGILVDALRQCGADISYEGEEGFPPLHIRGKALRGCTLTMDATVSSQYVSAMMMIAPAMEGSLRIELDGHPASAPYITLTAAMMRRAGVDVELLPYAVTVEEGCYAPCGFRIGGDWSAASYWFEIEALTCGCISLQGLDEKSMQGDSSVVELFRSFGIEARDSEDEPSTLDLLPGPDNMPRLIHDFSATPDLVQTAAVTAAMLGIPFRFSGVGSLRIKETDRLGALRAELLKVGVRLADDDPDVLEWDGRRLPLTELPVFDTYSDHRMAMALAPVAVFIPGIVVRDVEVVDKSYPRFFDDLRGAGFLTVDPSVPAEEVQRMLDEMNEEEE